MNYSVLKSLQEKSFSCSMQQPNLNDPIKNITPPKEFASPGKRNSRTSSSLIDPRLNSKEIVIFEEPRKKSRAKKSAAVVSIEKEPEKLYIPSEKAVSLQNTFLKPSAPQDSLDMSSAASKEPPVASQLPIEKVLSTENTLTTQIPQVQAPIIPTLPISDNSSKSSSSVSDEKEEPPTPITPALNSTNIIPSPPPRLTPSPPKNFRQPGLSRQYSGQSLHPRKLFSEKEM